MKKKKKKQTNKPFEKIRERAEERRRKDIPVGDENPQIHAIIDGELVQDVDAGEPDLDQNHSQRWLKPLHPRSTHPHFFFFSSSFNKVSMERNNKPRKIDRTK